MKSAPTIAFDWRRARGWRMVRWSTLGVGALCLAWAGLEPLAKLVLAVLLVWLEWRTLRFEARWDRSSWMVDGEGTWRWRRGEGSEGDAAMLQATTLGPLIVLNLRGATGRIDLPIWPDQLDATTRRHLRVRLASSPQNRPLLQS